MAKLMGHIWLVVHIPSSTGTWSFTWWVACRRGSNAVIRSLAFQYDKADQMKVIIMLYKTTDAMEHLRTKSDGIVSIQLRVAGPEGGATGLVESKCVRIWAISLCGTRTIRTKRLDTKNARTKVWIIHHAWGGARSGAGEASSAAVGGIGLTHISIKPTQLKLHDILTGFPSMFAWQALLHPTGKPEGSKGPWIGAGPKHNIPSSRENN